MADNAVMAEIKARETARAQALCDAVDRVVYNSTEGREAVASMLRRLVDDLRGTAELYLKAKLRGGKSTADELRAAARVLEPLIKQVEQLFDEESAPSRPVVEPMLPSEWCGNSEDHEPHMYEHPDHNVGQTECGGHRPRDLSGLDALIAERTAVPASPREDVEAYLRGQTDELPGWQPLGPSTVTDRTQESAVQFEDPDVPADWSSETTTSDGYRVPGLIEFDDPDPPRRRERPGRVVTWEMLGNLLDQDARGGLLPAHLSHSQMATLGECGAKALMTRSETLGVVERPSWSLVGGSAFHAAVEWFERVVDEVKTPQFVRDRLSVLRQEMNAATAVQALWLKSFNDEITQTMLNNSGFPQDEWHAANRGAENFTWWLVEGEDIVERYVTARLAELDDLGRGWRKIRKTPAGPAEPTDTAPPVMFPMIEWPFEIRVGDVPYRGVIDQVWNVVEDHGPMRAGDLLIDDCKSGKTVKGDDVSQLGEYALWLSRFGGGENRRIWGRFYDARRGTWTEPVDLLAVHPWERLEFEVREADLRKARGMFRPIRSNYCGGCSVKHACPLFASVTA